MQLEQWLSIQGWAYILLQEGADPDAIVAKFNEVADNRSGETARQVGLHIAYHLQKVPDIYLHSKRQAQIGETGDANYVYLFSIVAVFVLIIACINFMNLSTARSANRAREVGLRKTFGAYRSNIISQFLSESVLLSVCAVVIAVLIAAAALPYFNSISGKEFSVALLLSPQNLLGLLSLMIVTGLFAGSYPAFFLSSFRPIAVLRGSLSKGAKSGTLRKALVVFQFSISIALIICTFIVVSQVNFMKNKSLGFDKDQVMAVVNRSQNVSDNQRSFKQELLRSPRIKNVTTSTVIPGRFGEVRLGIPEGKTDAETFTVNVLRCDYDFVETYGIPMAAGRDFSQEFQTDTSSAVVINETAARTFGWTPEEAIGKQFRFAETENVTVIGSDERLSFPLPA